MPANYQVIDVATLHPTDPRSGYPTPTLLYEGRDLFGLPEPQPPFPEPACRLYKDGLPSSADIEARLKAASAG